MRIGFFATEADELDVWRMVFAMPDMRVFESRSLGERPLREFVNPGEILETRAAGRPGLGVAAVPFSAGGPPQYEKIIHDEAVAKRGEGRWSHALRGPTLINFMRYPQHRPDSLRECTFTGWNEIGAFGRSMYSDEHLEDVDWKKFRSVFRKLQRQIDGMAHAKLGSAHILPDAFRKLSAGEITLWGGGEEVSISSPHLSIKAVKLN